MLFRKEARDISEGIVTKLIIQIPCYNEELSINQTLSDLPKNIEGIDEIEVIVIDDGSTDKSAEIASKNGARVLQIKHNKGLANAFRVGLQECLNSGADIIVNTDADNQYNGADIEKLVKPILRGEADIVVGARDIANIKTFSFVKKLLQKFGSAVLRLLSSTDVQDAPSGFRAISRDAALKLNIFDNYTYTMEMLVQAGAKGMRVVSVPIRVNPTERKSKLVKNIFCYVCKSMKTMIRIFITISCVLGILGLFLVLRFLYYYMLGSGNGHVQSLIFSAVFLISAVQIAIVAIAGDLISINRKLLEDIQKRVKEIEYKN